VTPVILMVVVYGAVLMVISYFVISSLRSDDWPRPLDPKRFVRRSR